MSKIILGDIVEEGSSIPAAVTVNAPFCLLVASIFVP